MNIPILQMRDWKTERCAQDYEWHLNQQHPRSQHWTIMPHQPPFFFFVQQKHGRFCWTNLLDYVGRKVRRLTFSSWRKSTGHFGQLAWLKTRSMWKAVACARDWQQGGQCASPPSCLVYCLWAIHSSGASILRWNLDWPAEDCFIITHTHTQFPIPT